MALDVLKAEFQKSRFAYKYHDQRVFYCSQWKFPHRIIFVVIRTVLSAYSLFALIHFAVKSRNDNIMVFFTMWSYIMLTLHLAWAAGLSMVFYRKAHHNKVFHVDGQSNGTTVDSHCIEIQQHPIQTISISNHHDSKAINGTTSDTINTNNASKIGGHLPTGSGSFSPVSQEAAVLTSRSSTEWYFMVSWCLSSVNVCAAPVVTSIYFIAIYPSMKWGISFIDVNVHILNTVFVLIDFFVSSRPLRLLHVIAPTVYGLCWVIFSVIYWSTDHVNHIVYEMIDWNKPGITFVWVIGIMVLFIGLKFIYFGLYRLKIWLFTAIHKEDYFVDIARD